MYNREELQTVASRGLAASIVHPYRETDSFVFCDFLSLPLIANKGITGLWPKGRRYLLPDEPTGSDPGSGCVSSSPFLEYPVPSVLKEFG